MKYFPLVLSAAIFAGSAAAADLTAVPSGKYYVEGQKGPQAEEVTPQ